MFLPNNFKTFDMIQKEKKMLKVICMFQIMFDRQRTIIARTLNSNIKLKDQLTAKNYDNKAY